MKISYSLIALMLTASLAAMAQDPYINDRLTATDDLDGTARYVGMGGALGALGADISVISSNPAGIGLYRKNDLTLTFGAVVPNKANGWNSADARTYGEKLARASFDQLGFVWSMKMGTGKLRNVNFAANYQKKANYNLGFYADNLNLGGLSQMDQVAELANAGYDTDYNLAGWALDNDYLTTTKDAEGKITSAVNNYNGQSGYTTHHQRGSMQAFDLNLSFNVNNRFYTGVTFGVDNMNYKAWTAYSEQSVDGSGNYGDYTLYNDRDIDATGINVKFGFIVRPIEENPLRLGLTVETPTWYRMKSSTLFDLTDDVTGVRTNTLESYIETVVRTPWCARLSLGSTVDRILAWGVEYEYANMSKTNMGYPSYDSYDPYHSSYSNTKDLAMNKLTKNTLRAQHTLKAGIEVNPANAIAVRFGYNFISNRYKDNPSFDQYNLDSHAMNYATSTDYMTLGAANIITAGLGYKYKKFYIDLAYKYRMQKAKYYAFDTSFTDPAGDFAALNPTLAGLSIAPVDIDFNRHQLMLSLGFKF